MEQVDTGVHQKLIQDSDEEDKANASKWKERLLVLTLLACQFTALCTDTFLFPFFPQKAKSKGLTETQIGMVFSSFELARFLTSLLVGYVIGRLNPRLICLAGSITAATTCILFGLTTYAPDSVYLPLCIIVRLLAGAGTATLSVSVMTILMKATSYEPSTIVGMSEMMQGAGYAVGPALGSGLQELGGYTCMFWTVGSLLFLTCVVQPFTVPSIEPESSQKKASWEMMKIPGVILLFLHIFVYKTISSCRATGISNYLISTFEVKSYVVGLLFGVWSAVYLIACPLMTKLFNKGYIFSSMLIAWMSSILINMFAGPSPLLDFIFHGHSYLELPAILLSVANIAQLAIYVPPFQGAINLASLYGYDKNSVQTYGMVTGLLNGGLGLGSMVGPLIGGIITEHTNYRWTLTVNAALGLTMLSALSLYLMWMKITKQPLKPATDVSESDSGEGEHCEIEHRGIKKETPLDTAAHRSKKQVFDKQIAEKLEYFMNDSVKDCTVASHVQLEQ